MSHGETARALKAKSAVPELLDLTDDLAALNCLEQHGIHELGNGNIVAPWLDLNDDCKSEISYLCAEWDFAYYDTSISRMKLLMLSWNGSENLPLVANTPFGPFVIDHCKNPISAYHKVDLTIPGWEARVPLRSIKEAKEQALLNYITRAKRMFTTIEKDA